MENQNENINQELDYIVVEDENGNEIEFTVDAFFEMADHSYALLSSEDEVTIMRVEEENGEQVLVGISDEELESVWNAYEIALEASVEDQEDEIEYVH